jgi:hypothetical protein
MVVASEASSIPIKTAEGFADPRSGLDVDALAMLENVSQSSAIDDTLLSPERAVEMRRAIRQALSTINRLDVEKLIGQHGWLARLTGADIEARLRFELAAKQVEAALEALEHASRRARALLAAMEGESAEIMRRQPDIEGAITIGQDMLASDNGADPGLRDRFERRLANLMAIHAANDLAFAQFHIAITGLTALLDRYTDIATVVVPLWRQHLFAILHAQARIRLQDDHVQDFLLCHAALAEYFTGELRT